jgi:hypothetical protein
MSGSRYWTGRSMEWALEAGDRLMTSWALFRRGEHAAADGNAATAAGLAGAARREGGELPSPMLAAILQQEAHAYALDGAEAACQTALDHARDKAASPDDPGDASSGHGSFCTPGYVEMQRGRCWLRLGRPLRGAEPRSERESQMGHRGRHHRRRGRVGYRQRRGGRHRPRALSGKTAKLHDTLSRKFDILDLGRYQGR